MAFIIGGLREIGEPARKAMIVDLAEPEVRARTVGLYYLMRSLAITPRRPSVDCFGSHPPHRS
jgi:hypothetical protein